MEKVTGPVLRDGAPEIGRRVYVKPYMYSVIAAGAAVCAGTVYNFRYGGVDLGYVLLTAITVGVSSRLTLKIPHLSSHITVSDTFIFLAALLYGAEVKESDTAAAALEVLAGWNPDVLVSDIGMPGEDGYDLIRNVRTLPEECGGRTPAAALTAYARDEDRSRVLAAGYQAHLAKPVGARELVYAVADLAGRSQVPPLGAAVAAGATQ